MGKYKYLANLVLLSIAISAKSQDFPPSLDGPKPWCYNVDIAAPGGTYYTMTNPQLYLLKSGDMVAMIMAQKALSDAVILNLKFLWFVSHNRGLTWEPLKSIPPEFVPLGPSKLPLRALKLRDGTLLATGNWGWENFPESERQKLASQGYFLFDAAGGNAPGTVSVMRRILMSRSKDGGMTWKTEDVKHPFMAEVAIGNNPILLRDGTYLQPGYGLFDLKKEPKFMSSLVLRTEDGGDHWQISTVAKAKDFDFNETSITEAPNGDLVAVIRTTGQKELWVAISKDKGKSWLPPRDSGMRGSTPWVVTTNQGLVVAVYARRDKKYFPSTGIVACISRDNGQTWDVKHEAMLRDNGTAIVDGSPQVVVLSDGSVYTVYSLMLSVPTRTLPGTVSAEARHSIGGTGFSPLYQGLRVLPFDQAPEESH